MLKTVVILSILFSSLSALNENQIKAVYTYNFIKNISWENSSETHNLLVLTNDEELKKIFSIIASKKRVNGKRIKVTFSTSKNIKERYSSIFIDDSYNSNYKNIFQQITEDKGTLLISNNMSDKKIVMINLFHNGVENIDFELNRANIINQNLKISPDMVLLGGRDIDVAEIYRDIQDTLSKKKEEFAKLDNQMKEIRQSSINLKKEIDSHKLEIENQKNLLKNNSLRLQNRDRELRDKNRDLVNKNIVIKKRELELKKQEIEFQTLTKILEDGAIQLEYQKTILESNRKENLKNSLKIEEKEKTLLKLNLAIDKQVEFMDNQTLTIKHQDSEIEKLIFAVFIFIALVIIAIIAYFKIKKDKKTIDTQLSELQIIYSQRDKLHQNIRASIKFASLIQKALFPDISILAKYTKEHFTFWQPRDTVGGDIYLVTELESKNEIIIMVIDGAGHGVPGAFVTMLVKAIETQIINDIENKKLEPSPAKILEYFNRTIKKMLKQEKGSKSNAGFDGGILYFNREKNICKYAGAKTPLYIIQDGKLEILKSDRKNVGFIRTKIDQKYMEYDIEIKEGTQFYLCTDGIIDQEGMADERYGKNRFEKLILENSNLPISEQKDILVNSFENFKSTFEQSDDVTVLGLRF